MGIQRKAPRPVGIVNASGQPEIVLEIEGLTLSMTPPANAATPAAADSSVPAVPVPAAGSDTETDPS